MASQSQSKLSVSILPESDSGSGSGVASLPKGQCLCSPTTHEGSFRCRFHRSVTASSSPPSWMKRSKTN
ncbi:hypothetical protein E2542_SST18002 [Spatholobus suberectus]|nr:hypothetical protein E2542_SST18002 [Spatholobus suberectus]